MALTRHSLVFAALPSSNNAYKVAIHHTELELSQPTFLTLILAVSLTTEISPWQAP